MAPDTVEINEVIWSLFPQGIVLPWITKSDLPDNMKRDWAFCNGTTVNGYKTPKIDDGRFLMGVGPIDETTVQQGGTDSHRHHVVNTALREGAGFEFEGRNAPGATTTYDDDPSKRQNMTPHIPPFQVVRYIIKTSKGLA